MREKVKFYIKENYIELFVLIVFIVLTYGYEISNWTMTIDEEINSNISRYKSFVGWSTQGRWGIGLIKLILPTYQVLPFWNGFLAIIVLALGALIICKICDWFKVGVLEHCVAIMFFISVPIHSFYLMFDTYSVEVSIGICLALWAGYSTILSLCYTGKRKDLIIGTVCLVFAIGIYQLLLQIYVCIVCVGLLAYTSSNKIKLKKYIYCVFQAIFTLIGALVGYTLVDKVIKSQIKVNDLYIDSFFKWGSYDVKTVVAWIKDQLKILYLTPDKLYSGGEILIFSYLILFAVVIKQIIQKKENAFVIMISALGMYLSISLGVIALGGGVPLRTYQIIPVFISIVLAVGLGILIDYRFFNKIKIVAFMMLIIVSLNQSARVVQLYYSENNRQTRDLFLTYNVASEIQKLNLGICPQYPVVFLGWPETMDDNLVKEELFSLSMLKTGEIRRTYIWFSLQGYSYIMPTEEERDRAEILAKEKPSWPYSGSVFFEDGLVVVKFSE